MVATQKIHVGMIHARKTVTVTADSNSFTVAAGEETKPSCPHHQQGDQPLEGLRREENT
jgi:hypothetical protein